MKGIIRLLCGMESLDVQYFPEFLSKTEAIDIFKDLLLYDFQQYPVKVKGKLHTPSCKVCAFGDENLDYTFSGLTLPVSPWTQQLLNLKSAVENACKQTFNYALLNYYECGVDKIGMHKDNESCLDLNASIACVSLGAARTIHFTRKNFNTVKLALENGSLLIINPVANTLWCHEIPSELKVKEPRISVTFRKIFENSKCYEISQLLNKRTHLQEMLVDKSMDEVFTSISQNHDNQSKAASVTMSTISNNGENLYQKDLGNCIFLCIELIQEHLYICIRQYDTQNKIFIPISEGVNMNLSTWHEFYHKLFNFNLRYTNASFIANNSILVLNIDECMHVQYFICKKSSIQLNFSQVEILKETVYELNDVLMNFLLSKRLTFFIRRECRWVDILTVDQEEYLLLILINCIEAELVNVFKKVFECLGCIVNHPKQFLHSCITLSNLEKMSILGDEIFLLVNMEAIALNFANCVNCISESFLSNISIPYILNVLFKT